MSIRSIAASTLATGAAVTGLAVAGATGTLADRFSTPGTRPGLGVVLAKTGTLTGVSSYAGYVRRGGAWEPFALLINQPVDGGLRRRVAAELVR